MAFFNGWPWAQFQEQNLDWLIKKVKELEEGRIDYMAFKKQVSEFMHNLNVPEELQRIVNEMIEDGSLQDIIEQIGIETLFDGAFLIPEQFKTESNSWDDAFNLMIAEAGNGSQIVIPDHTYNLLKPHFLPFNTVNNAGVYPEAKAYEPERVNVQNYGHPRANSIVSPVTAIQGATLHDGLLAIAEVETNDIYLNIKYAQTGVSVARYRLGNYADVHAGSVAWDADAERYVISTGAADKICICSPDGVVNIITASIGITINMLAKVPGGFVIGNRTQGFKVTDNEFNPLYQISAAGFPALVNSNPYTDLQDIEYYNGCLYYLYSCFDRIDNYASGFYIYRSDLAPVPTFELVEQRLYNDVVFEGFEAEHIIIDSDGLFHVGAYNGLYYFLMTYNNDNTLMDNNNRRVTIRANESATSYGNGTQATPFNCLFTALYYAVKSNSALHLTDCVFPITSYYRLNLIMELHNTVLTGDWRLSNIELDNSDILVGPGILYIQNMSRFSFNNCSIEPVEDYSRDIIMQGGTSAEITFTNCNFTALQATHHVGYFVKCKIYTAEISSNTDNMFYIVRDNLLVRMDNQTYSNSQDGSNKIL